MNLLRTFVPLALLGALGGCALLGGGKVPATVQTLTPLAADPGEVARAANAGQAVTIAVPVIAKELRTLRVPVQVTPTDIQYVTDLQWVDTPDRLFQQLLAETVRRTTGRVVLDSRQAGLDPGLVVSGQLQRFGYDAYNQQVVVVYDASLSTAGGSRVETRRFTARQPAASTAAAIGPALNQAANQVAIEAARWIGG